jgi:hypothetical protein
VNHKMFGYRIRIPREVYQLVRRCCLYGCGDDRELMFDGLSRLVESELAKHAVIKNSFAVEYADIHQMRIDLNSSHSRSCIPSVDEFVLFQLITNWFNCNGRISYNLNDSINPFALGTFPITEKIDRVAIRLHIPRLLMACADHVRGDYSRDDFIAQAIWFELEHRLTLCNCPPSFGDQNMTGNNDYLPANKTESAQLLGEVKELRRRLTRLEMINFTPAQNTELVIEVLRQLINSTRAMKDGG